MITLNNQSALVTGASSGIGWAIAVALGKAGANVAINYHLDQEGADRAAQEIRREKGRAFVIQADVSDEAQVASMFQETLREFKALDILVSNAGIQKDAKFVEMTLDQWQGVLGTNLTGAFLCAREAARIFLRQGLVPNRSRAAGKIIFVSSVHQAIPWAGHANYAASKGGMLLLMKTIAQELAPYKVRVNAIAPGAIKTPINRKAWETPEAEDSLLKLIPYDRVGETQDVAPVAVWLASDQSDYVTGTTLYVDGGMLLYPGFRTGG
ncbi:MAG TPA: SDR family oxidoreductase [Thermodesulfobacteriota bacterium]|nr:SDR family oxidoreductase [Thermodesulfobacteriota bacterium]